MATVSKTPGPEAHAQPAPERIADLASQLSKHVNHSLNEIQHITTNSRLLSLNAQVEAARAGGTTGAAFSVVASAMQQLSEQTSSVASDMVEQTGQAISELSAISKSLAFDVRGTRLADLALTNIDLIDRCLYERSCDCRWWATDSSAVNALASQSPEDSRYCSRRLGVILDSYTVYLDLVICNLDGMVIANGRPQKYRTVGDDVSRTEWFQSAMKTNSGEEFGFESVHRSQLCGGEPVLAYSCAVREKGDVHGEIIGVLGIFFNWQSLAGKIVNECPLSAEEKEKTHVMICDPQGLVLADNRGTMLKATLNFSEKQSVFAKKKCFEQCVVEAQQQIVAHAQAPGFETYSTGWHSVIVQPIRMD